MTQIDIALKILDHQILDRDGRRCGNVDDLEIEGGPGETARVTAILVGPGVWRQRSRWIGGTVTGLVVGTRGLLEHFAVLRRRSTAAIPWTDVLRIEGKRIIVRDP